MDSKHEIIRCERCGSSMECKANANGKCQCSSVELNLNEMQYISENYEGCVCGMFGGITERIRIGAWIVIQQWCKKLANRIK